MLRFFLLPFFFFFLSDLLPFLLLNISTRNSNLFQ